jgi:hypothetical protein
MIVPGGKIYETCTYCNKLVRINMSIFEGWHFCLTRKERDNIDYQRKKIIMQDIYIIGNKQQ